METSVRYVLTVSELTREIKDLLEMKFSDLWIEGEISNVRIPPSGHHYFTLKDDYSQIRAVLFKSQARSLRFTPEDGLHVICCGRVSLYEKRGEYQLILESMEPKGIGALQLAFLQLKERLEKEGLFDRAHKKALPMVPQKIGVVTSPTGAVIRDILNIIARRFENIHLLLYPVRVQGEGASLEIAEAIAYFNDQTDVEVIIVARGGGSLEDLWAFNEERVARAIYASRIPIISAVGHETDYTIADFVADLRAPTPSAAAELAVRDKKETQQVLQSFQTRLEHQISQILGEYRTHLSHFRKRLGDPRKRIQDYFLRTDEWLNRISLLVSWNLTRIRENYSHLKTKLDHQHPGQRIETLRRLIVLSQRQMDQTIRHILEIQKQKLQGRIGKLDSLSPLGILKRGYSITRKVPSGEILRNSSHANEGDRVEVTLHQGTLLCSVEKTERP